VVAEGRRRVNRAALLAALDEAISLLQLCGRDGPADWLSERRGKLANPISTAEDDRVLAEVRSILAGMGSFTDLGLQPPPASGITTEEVNRRVWDLAERLDALTEPPG
jgi:hypothetical protein